MDLNGDFVYALKRYYTMERSNKDGHLILQDVVTLDVVELSQIKYCEIVPARARAWNALDVLAEMGLSGGKLKIVGRGEEEVVYTVDKVTDKGVILRPPKCLRDEIEDRFIEYKILFAGYKKKDWTPCGVLSHLCYSAVTGPLSGKEFQKECWIEDGVHQTAVCGVIAKMQEIIKKEGEPEA